MARDFICPGCKHSTLKLRRSLDLGPDGDSDEVAIQTLACATCDVRAVGIYSESRRGSRESVHHFAYPMTAGPWEKLHKKLRRCWRPHKPSCTCKIHREFRIVDEYSCLDPLANIDYDEDACFDLRLGTSTG